MPAAVVGRQVEVIELFGEIGLAPAPVQAQVLDQKAGRDHAQPVVHIAAGIELAHGGIDQRVAGAAFAPGGKEGVGLGSRLPFDGVIRRLEAALHHIRLVGQDLEVEVAPDQLAEPGGRPFACRGRPVLVVGRLMGEAGQLAYRHGAKAQMDAEIAGPLEGRKVACRLVLRQARQKIGQQLARAADAGGQAQAGQRVRGKAQIRSRGNRAALAVRQIGQLARQIALAGVGREIERCDFSQPGVLVGREDRKWRQALGQHLVARKDAVVLEAQQQLPLALEAARHLGVAGDGRRLVVVVAEDGARAQLPGQGRDDVLGQAAPRDQPCLRASCGLAQGCIQLGQTLADELHAAVGAGQGGKNAVVEDKDAIQLFTLLQCMIKGRVIGQAQVAPQPDQAHRVRRSHGSPVKSLHVCRICAYQLDAPLPDCHARPGR